MDATGTLPGVGVVQSPVCWTTSEWSLQPLAVFNASTCRRHVGGSTVKAHAKKHPTCLQGALGCPGCSGARLPYFLDFQPMERARR
eukprot:2032199-Pyramimonas_sp.AAC.1